jgi:uncharacterized repeat protein (TIGR03847 family)
MGVFYEFDEVDAFTVGAVGEPGARTFFLQARRGTTRVSVKCEKLQASAIADYLAKVLDDLPAVSDSPLPAAMELSDPVEAAFVLGPVGLGYDRPNDRVLLQLEEVVPTDEEGEPDPAAVEDRGHLRVFLTRSQARGFCERASTVVSAGRPACLFCGLPKDPAGHICPRMN